MNLLAIRPYVASLIWCLIPVVTTAQAVRVVQPVAAPVATAPISLPRDVSVAEAIAHAAPIAAPIQSSTDMESLARFSLAPGAGACFPPNPKPAIGLLPAQLNAEGGTVIYPAFNWALERSDLNYVIQRAVQGSTTWQIVTSTCNRSSASFLGAIALGVNPKWMDHMEFIDGSGGFVPGTTYIYMVTAIAPDGSTSWLSFHWTAPQLPVASVANIVYQGSTVNLSFEINFYLRPQRLELTSSFGTKLLFAGNVFGPCTKEGTAKDPLFKCSAQIAAPMGKSTLRIFGYWQRNWDGIVHILARSAGAPYVINVQP